VFWAFWTLLPGENLLTQPSNIALFFVGVTSFLFHLTLKYETQVMDDLSMFWVCAALVHELYTLDWERNSRLAFGTILSGVLVVISIYHYYLHQLWLHNLTFISLVTAVSKPMSISRESRPGTFFSHVLTLLQIWPRVLYLIRTRFKDEQRRYWTGEFRVGGFCFMLGFVVWALDSAYCDLLRETRKSIGIPYAFLLELHGWWHVLTALGAGYCIRVMKILTRKQKTT
jgi:dihydroceramidase